MTRPSDTPRRFTWGAEPGAGGASFRLWAPALRRLRVRVRDCEHDMHPAGEGWFEARVEGAGPGDDYAFVLEDGSAVPDPASRLQSGDVHGPSLIVDPSTWRWQHDWTGRPWEEAVILELHTGAFTPEGTFRAAIDRLPHLARTGITAIELMPLAQFAGHRGWGYDGVLPSAPHPAYGTPDDLRALVDAAHGEGLMVLLDVVWNHFGPEGNYLARYAPDFFRTDRETPWGAAIAYHRRPVRDFFIESAFHWLEDYRFDGFRFDAIDQVQDPDSPVEILVEAAERLRAAHPGRLIHLTTEDDRNITRLHERGPDGAPRLHTAEWNDDLHNAAHALATGENEGYYRDFAAEPVAFYARALAEGFAYQGEPSVHEGGAPRGAPSGHLPPAAFVDFLQNHDQTGNRAFGERLLTLAGEETMRFLSAILLLSPHIPLLFMGEEWGETRPFLFFSDYEGPLADAVREGRRREFKGFAAFDDPASLARIPDPNAPATFEASRIDWAKAETPEGADWLHHTRTLLALRHSEIVPRLRGAPPHSGRVLVGRDRLVAVDWRLDGAELRLRANLSDRPARLPPAPGRVLHAHPEAPPDAPLPPLGVLVTLDEAGAGAGQGTAVREETERDEPPWEDTP